MTSSRFTQLGLKEGIVQAIEDMGWEEPTPIQVESVPYGIKGRDILAQAQTGTGKTGAYGSIILDSIDAKKGWAQALVLVPTRELALQVCEELGRLSKYTGHGIVPVYGGVSMLKQTQAMDKGVDIIVATPGRLCDHLKDDQRLLDDVSVVILDEADRMLDMGFRKDLDFILEHVPEDRQTMLLSATVSNDIRKLSKRYLVDPKEISVSKDEMVLDLIDQRYMMVEKEDKMDLLKYVLAKDPKKTIVFCFTKYRVDKVVRKLKMSFRLAGIHGEYSQNRREETMRRFREGDIQVLVASDIAARGLDIEDVERIINFDMPPEAETYVHRIGRTGRAGNNGLALSFVMKEDRKLLKQIENLTLSPMEEMPVPSEKEMAEVFKGIKGLSKPVMAKKNSRKNDVPVKDKVFIVAEINVGKVDGQSKATISQMVKDNTTVPKKSIGNIYIGERTSTLEVEKKYYSRTEEGISKCSANGKKVKMWVVSEVEEPITETLEDAVETVKKVTGQKKVPVRKTVVKNGPSDRNRSDSRKPHGEGRSNYRSKEGGREGKPSYRGQGRDRPRDGKHDERPSYRKNSGRDRPRDGDRSRRPVNRPKDGDDRDGTRKYNDAGYTGNRRSSGKGSRNGRNRSGISY